jgi:hypothetical protein
MDTEKPSFTHLQQILRENGTIEIVPIEPGETRDSEPMPPHPWQETSGERSASDNVEEEGEPNDPIPDSGSAPSPS